MADKQKKLNGICDSFHYCLKRRYDSDAIKLWYEMMEECVLGCIKSRHPFSEDMLMLVWQYREEMSATAQI